MNGRVDYSEICTTVGSARAKVWLVDLDRQFSGQVGVVSAYSISSNTRLISSSTSLALMVAEMLRAETGLAPWAWASRAIAARVSFGGTKFIRSRGLAQASSNSGITVRAIVLRSVPRFASCCLLAINEACASKRSAWMAVYVDTASRADGRSEVVDALRLEFRVPDHRVD